ncbi:diguanylate cyclase domain-containing protein [Thalassobacillus hwangdonensis]|uniref:Diguanylate cyclase domain-containing protein n=1 Tax=Thalassobacillus hwangdonensis TaxID=546108 RepID=A0ABW3L144_9BACI
MKMSTVHDLIEHSPSMLKQVFDTISDGVLLYEKVEGAYRCVFLNNEAKKYFHTQGILYKRLDQAHDAATASYLREWLDRSVTTDVNAHSFSEEGLGFKGELTIHPFKGESGEYTYYVVMFRNIHAFKKNTELIEKKQRLEEMQDRYQALVEMSPDAVFVHDEREQIMYVNDAGVQLLRGKTQENLIGNSIYDYIDIESTSTIKNRLMEIIEKGDKSGPVERRFIKSDGTAFYVEVHAGRVKYNGRYAVQTICRDITERKKYEKHLEEMAYLDQLTRIPNRRYFYQQLEDAMTATGRNMHPSLALLYIDLDNFKEINDTFGHQAGDEVLIIFAKRVQKVLRGEDVFARLGGDEFVVMIPELEDQSLTVEIANRILSHVEQPIVLNQGTIDLTLSIGISVYPSHAENGRELLHHADLALYEAKKEDHIRIKCYES